MVFWASKHPGNARKASDAAKALAGKLDLPEPRPLSPDADVVFAITLIGEDRAKDWDLVCRQLEATLKCFLRQTDGRWRALVCGQDAPECLELDPRIEFLRHPDRIPRGRSVSDRPEKFERMVAHLAEQGKDIYYFPFDADDYLHPRVVEHMLTDRDPSGYVLTKGYMLDVSRGDMAYLYERPFSFSGSGRFNAHCGSCAAIRADFAHVPQMAEVLLNRGNHNRQHNELAAFGLKLKVVPFPAAVYLVNHSESLRQRRGNRSGRPDYMDRNLMTTEKQHQVMSEFGVGG